MGAHLSTQGGVHLGLERARDLGCAAVQIFTRNQRQWAIPPLQPEALRCFRALLPLFHSVFAHASYLINPAAADPAKRRRSRHSLTAELTRCSVLGISDLVLHPGSHGGAGCRAGIRRAARTIASAHRGAHVGTRVLLETMPGAGTQICSTFAEISDLLSLLRSEGIPAGVCLDTAHVFAAGHDLGSTEGVTTTTTQLLDAVGGSSLVLVHANDTMHPCGSHRDRHCHIGEGSIGRGGFAALLTAPLLRGIPFCLETPKDSPDADQRNLRVLRGLSVDMSG